MKINKLLLYCLGFIGSALLLTVIQPPFGCSTLVWVSLVPFILVSSPKAKPGRLAIIAYLVGLCYWLGNLYWIAPVTCLGWLAFCLYTALLWPVLSLCLRYCRMKKVPLVLASAVLFVGAERLQGLFLGGFHWRLLAHSQYANVTLIQIADIFGAGGVSFLTAMVNGLICELIIAARQKELLRAGSFVKTALVCAAVVLALAYGAWRISQSDECVELGPMVGSCQSNVPQSVKDSGSPKADKEIFDGLLAKSKTCAEAGAELIVWPETMVAAVLDQRVLRLLDSSSVHRTFDRTLREHSKNTAFLLVGATGGEPKIQTDGMVHFTRRYNSAFLYKPDGSRAEKQYDKIHLVPFGEVVPFKKTAPWLHSLLMKLTPYDYDYTLDYGGEYTVFEMAGSQHQETKVYRFSVMICYEDTVPAIARRFALDDQGRKRLHWLVNISNDGWFVRFSNGKVSPSTELVQHTAICVFRAVENRLAVLRSVNTGISCLIDTVGRVKNGFLAGTLPNKAMARKGVAGWFADKMPIDKRVTFFSKYGQWLDFCCAGASFLLIAGPALERFVRNKKFAGAAG